MMKVGNPLDRMVYALDFFCHRIVSITLALSISLFMLLTYGVSKINTLRVSMVFKMLEDSLHIALKFLSYSFADSSCNARNSMDRIILIHDVEVVSSKSNLSVKL